MLDSSCSVVSSYDGLYDAYAGSIVGYLHGYPLEGCVNMAKVSFTGSIGGSKTLFFFFFLVGLLGISIHQT